MKFQSIPFFLSIILVGCGLFQSEEDKGVVARVGDEYLYLEDIENLVAEEGKEDSAAQIQAYIDSWIKEQLLLRKALDNLTEEQSDFEEQLRNYRNSLLIYAFENKLIAQKLDTTISPNEYQEYYENNQQNFKLRENVYKAKFVRFLNSAPEQDSLEYWLFSEEESLDYLSEYCTQFASGCHLDTLVWIPFTKIKELFQKQDDKNIYLSKGKNTLSDSLQTMLLYIYDIRKEEQTAPLAYVREQIRNIIINKRKTQLISKVKEEIFEEATLKRHYEVFQ